MSKYAVFEIFETLNSIEDKENRLESLKTIPNNIQQLLYFWLNPDVVFLLPESDPPFTKANSVNTHNVFWSDIRRVKIFIKGFEYDNLNSSRREQLFISMLENIHPKDAELLLNIKNRVWPYNTFQQSDVAEVFPTIVQGHG